MIPSVHGRARAARRGYHMGPVPFGYRRAGRARLEADPVEAPIVRGIFAAYLQFRSIYRLAAHLAALGILTRAGGPWDPRTLATVLHRPVYVGLVTFQGATTQGQHEPLVALDVFRQVRRRLKTNRRKAASA